MSYRKYMVIDICMLCILAFGLELFCLRVLGGFITLGLTLSLAGIYRWNFKGIPIVLSSGLAWFVSFAMSYKTNMDALGYFECFLTEMVSTLGVYAALLLFKKFNKKIVKKDFQLLTLYCIIGYVGQSLCRFILYFFIENDFLRAFQLGFLDSGVRIMGLVVAAVLVMILSRMENVLVEPKQYIVGLDEERKKSYERFEGFVIPNKDEKEEKKEEKEVDSNDRISN